MRNKNMAHYIYEIRRNGIVEHTSPLFLNLKAAYADFIEQDAPNHYGKLKFSRSTASLFNKSTNIRVQFKKVESKPVSYEEWSDLCKEEGVVDE
jgi:hypothetical protein